jgi:hypothetical protein
VLKELSILYMASFLFVGTFLSIPVYLDNNNSDA